MKQAARNVRHTLNVLVGSALVTGILAVPAHAAAPANDSIAGAKRLTTVPSRFVHHSGEATADPTDGECVQGASVWYRYRPTTTSTVRVVTFGSDYDTVLAVFRGGQANRTLLGCNDDVVNELSTLASAVRVRFVAGRTYFIAVSACCDRSAAGGRGVLTVYRDRRSGVRTSIDSVETGEVSGRVFASGTTACDTPSVAEVDVTVSQRVGDHVARGTGVVGIDYCSPVATPWRIAIDSETGWAFQPGTAAVTADSFSDDAFSFVSRSRTMNAAVGSNPQAGARASRRQAARGTR